MAIGTLPKVRYIITGANVPAELEEQKILFVGQKLPAGTAVSKALTPSVASGTEDTLFGDNSILSQMIKRARVFNQVNRFDAIALDDNGAGTEATATITITGTATENKDLVVQIGNKDFEYSVTITSTTTGAAAATQLHTAINNATTFPYTSADDTLGELTITFAHEGTAGNELRMKTTSIPAGLSVALTPFTGGAGAVDVAGIFDNLSERYQTVIYSQDLDQDELTDWTEANFNVDNDIKDGEGLIGLTGTVSAIGTTADAENLRTLTYIANPDESLYFDTTTNIVSEIGAKRALRLSDGEDISNLVIDPVESRGGRSKASLPYFNTPLSLDLPDGRLTQLQIDSLVNSGVSVFVPNDANTIVLGEMVTTYKKNGVGIDDPSFKFLNYVDTTSVVREYFFLNTKNRFGQTRATAGTLIAGKSMSNETSVKAYLQELYQTMANDALLVAGDAAIEFFKANLAVTLDPASGTYTINMKIPIVTQAREFDGIMQISFTTEVL